MTRPPWDAPIYWDAPTSWDDFTPHRWSLKDPEDSSVYTFAVSPNEGGTPKRSKTITEQATAAPGGPTMLFEGADQPPTIEFSGTLLDQAQHDAFLTFWGKRRQVQLKDDLGRETWIYIVSLSVTRKRAAHRSWKHVYKIAGVLLSWP